MRGIIKRINAKSVELVAHEPHPDDERFIKSEFVNELKNFKTRFDVIFANRVVDTLNHVRDKVFTRGLSGND